MHPSSLRSAITTWLRLEHMLEMFRLIPNAQLGIIPNATHFVLNVDPDKLLPTVEPFSVSP